MVVDRRRVTRGGRAGRMAYEGEHELRKVDFRFFNLFFCPSKVDMLHPKDLKMS